MFSKVLIANRGEIAVRVMRACAELGIRTVAIYSDADRDAGHVRYADEAYNVGPARAADSYLDQETILEVAQNANVDAIHPGYGFLAENASFAALVEESDLTWVGPPSEAMAAVGEKTHARQVMQAADVPVVPGTTEPIASADEVREVAEEYGYPVAIKAAGGGGGRGLKVVTEPDEIDAQFESAKREGEAYFDNPSVYVEKFLESPKHIEVQVLCDQHGTVRHLGERDCSLQRRHQKVIEEAPSPSLDDELREEICEAACRGLEEVGYTNAGTVEFLVADDDFYFMEVNTRIQVEHCVTEAITGLDIVKWQLRIADGEEIDFAQEDVSLDGHAIEYRINAENPANGFSPGTGTLSTYRSPGGIGVRVDDAIREGDDVIGDYDSMIGKLIVSAEDRDECLARSERALSEFEIDGVHTTVPFHRLMLTDERFISGTHTTTYLDDELDPARIERAVDQWGPETTGSSTAQDDASIEREFTVEVDGKRFSVWLEDRSGGLTSTGQAGQSATGRKPAHRTSGQQHTGGDEQAVTGEGEQITAEMQGTILSVDVEEGDDVEAGEVLCVLEAMKMENDIVASRGGSVSQVLVEAGESVDMGDVLVVIE